MNPFRPAMNPFRPAMNPFSPCDKLPHSFTALLQKFNFLASAL
jgi:hypothetical protein